MHGDSAREHLVDNQAPQSTFDLLDNDGNELLYEYLMEEVHRLDTLRREAVEEALRSTQGLLSRQERLLARYREILGELPEKTPLNPMIRGSIECDGYRIERVIYESRPRHHVTANLYIPTAGPAPYPGVLVACGHSDNGKAFGNYQIVSALMAVNGFVALCYDPICQGERVQLPDAPRYGTTTHTLLNLGALLVGRSVVGYEAWDGIRSIDYLLSRPEVDPEKPVGMTGTSGGGTQTTFLMALDHRIGPAAPSCYVMTRARKFASHHGVADGCQHLPLEGKHGIDHTDYITMRAPKPTTILAARRDFFDIDGVREAAAEAGRIYGLLKHEERFELFESDDEHGFLPPHRSAAVNWMRRWLHPETDVAPESGIEARPDAELWAARGGQVFEEFADERSVADLNLERARELAETRRRFWSENPRETCLAEVRRLIGLREERGSVTAETVGLVERDGFRIEKTVIHRGGEVPVPSLLFVPDRLTGASPAAIYVDGGGKQSDAGPGGTIESIVRDGRIILSIDVRGFGETADSGSSGKYLNGEHRVAVLARHIGRPLLGQRVEDVLAALDVLSAREEVDSSRIDVVGIERGGPVVLHAAALDERIASVTLRDSIASWVDDVVARPLQEDLIGHVVPGALERYDLPDLVSIIAPRPVLGIDDAIRE